MKALAQARFRDVFAPEVVHLFAETAETDQIPFDLAAERLAQLAEAEDEDHAYLYFIGCKPSLRFSDWQDDRI